MAECVVVKYPSDAKNYHDIWKPGFSHTTRVPEDLLDTYMSLKRSLGARASHADVVRFLFEAAEAAITAQVQLAALRVIQDSKIHNFMVEGMGELDVVVDDERAQQMMVEVDDVVSDQEADPNDLTISNLLSEIEGVICRDSKRRAPGWIRAALDLWNDHKSKLHEVLLSMAAHDITYNFKSWIYMCAKNAALRGDTSPSVLMLDIHNSAHHWTEDHTTCQTLPGTCKCVVEEWPAGRDAKYSEGGETHKAMKDFLKKYIPENKVQFYLRAWENMSETFHSVINKYASERIHFEASHTAKLACSALRLE
ncbi:hypothetical protein R1sor_006001 [Riccia sorocarpa]|uniref:Transposase n=1 Tax=Riccia sorocarpa TaxID=122646 RepID=A0ABD3HPY9_9MARC